ncbi:uncharacterized protein LOC129910724 [Episyrphus balteatus]|uniref:uncharacterized protein LOC129910724 n=1 Tax=Episyrphus balteatus TaxID=286459 RepID=UPI0024860195|nr:uncharacterized protein LOC129910724 [Episyrphus balteatus]
MKSLLWLLISLSVVYGNKDDSRMRHNNPIHLDCFDVFIPLINRMANEAKDTSEACVATAEGQKDNEIVAINRTRSDLFSEVKRIKDTLTSCSTQNDHFGYFECLKGIVEIDRKVVGDITSKSSKYSNKLKEIDEQQIKCFRNSVSKIKEKSSNAIHSLQYCLTSGESARSADSPSHQGRESIQTTPMPYNYNHNYNQDDPRKQFFQLTKI